MKKNFNCLLFGTPSPDPVVTLFRSDTTGPAALILIIQHMPLIKRIVANEEIGELFYKIFSSREEFFPAIPYEPKSIYDESLKLADISEIYPVAWVDNLRVTEAYQHQGHGSWLLQKFEAACVESGVKLAVLKIGWNSIQEKDKNLNFYAHREWKPVQPSPNHSYLAFRSF